MAEVLQLPYDRNIPTPATALLIMTRDEEHNVGKTIGSLTALVSDVFLLDTGSTDRTVAVAQQVCDDAYIQLHVRRSEWVPVTEHFQKRNVLLDWFFDEQERRPAEKRWSWFIVADAVDEFRGVEYLRRFMHQSDGLYDLIYLFYVLQRKPLDDQQCDRLRDGETPEQRDQRVANYNKLEMFPMAKVFNLRDPAYTFRYRWRIHEQIHRWDPREKKFGGEVQAYIAHRFVHVYQNRIDDDAKSAKRYTTDLPAALLDHHDEPYETRPLMYIGQTIGNMGRYREALYWYLSNLRLHYDRDLCHSMSAPAMTQFVWRLHAALKGYLAKPRQERDPLQNPVDALELSHSSLVRKLERDEQYEQFVQELTLEQVQFTTGLRQPNPEAYIVCMRIVDILPLCKLEKQLQTDLAMLLVRQALHNNMFLAEAWCYYANLLHRQGQCQESYAVLKLAVELPEPGHCSYYRAQFFTYVRYSLLVSVAMLVGRLEEARHWLLYLQKQGLAMSTERHNLVLLEKLEARVRGQPQPDDDGAMVHIACCM